MLDFNNTVIDEAIVHYIGSSERNELILSSSTLDLENENLAKSLVVFFLNHFRSNGFYSFSHNTSLNLNEIYAYTSDFFESKLSLIEASQSIAQHLKHVSVHPNIKGGELYVASLKGCVVDGELVDAIGIYKSETKDNYIKVSRHGLSIKVNSETGTNPKRLDKACIILNTEKDLGYKVCIVDNTNKDEARYWVDDFLRIKLRNDNFYQTKNYIELCKGFVTEVFNNENKVDRADQVVMLNKAHDFFKTKDEFRKEEFEEEVMEQPEIIGAFRDYKKRYETEKGFEINDEFKISADVAKQSKKYFKSVIKLDKNFHVYIHGNREMVDRGFDEEKGMKYYKLYFEKED